MVRSTMSLGLVSVTIVACLVITAQAGPPIAQLQCQEGERAWCRSLETAKQCDRVQHCQDYVWSKMPQGKITCMMCEMVVGAITKELNSTTMEDDLKDAVLAVCSYMGPLQSTCENMIEGYFDEIWEHIVSKMDPDVICTLVKLCSSASLDSEELKLHAESGELCDLCEFAIKILKPVVDSSSTEAEVEQVFQTLCDLVLSKEQNMCKRFEEYFPMFWSLLKMEVDSDQLCELMQLCPTSSKKIVRLTVKK